MKWPTIPVICVSLLVAQGCAMNSETGEARDPSALERLYQADLARANDGAPDAMMRIGRYHDTGLSENDRCDGAMAPLCRFGVVSRWLAGTVVTQDRSRAYKWYSLAALRDHRNALEAKRSLVGEMTPDEIEAGKRLIAGWQASHGGPSRQRASGAAR